MICYLVCPSATHTLLFCCPDLSTRLKSIGVTFTVFKLTESCHEFSLHSLKLFNGKVRQILPVLSCPVCLSSSLILRGSHPHGQTTGCKVTDCVTAVTPVSSSEQVYDLLLFLVASVVPNSDLCEKPDKEARTKDLKR